MEDMIKRQGKTVLLVSHNIRQVERLCSRVLLLDHGQIMMDAGAQTTCNAYYEQNDEKIKKQVAHVKANQSTTGEVELLDFFLADMQGKRQDTIQYLSDFTVVIRLRAHKELIKPIIVFGVHTTDFVYVTTTTSPLNMRQSTLPRGIVEIQFVVEGCPLLPGAYSSRLSVDVEDPVKNIFYADSLCHFNVVAGDIQRTSSQCEGFFLINTRWNPPNILEAPARFSDCGQTG